MKLNVKINLLLTAGDIYDLSDNLEAVIAAKECPYWVSSSVVQCVSSAVDMQPAISKREGQKI